MPRYANAEEGERILKTLRTVFIVLISHKGKYDEPGFVPGYGKYQDDWSDQKIADLVGGKVARNTVAYLRQNWFGNLTLKRHPSDPPPTLSIVPAATAAPAKDTIPGSLLRAQIKQDLNDLVVEVLLKNAPTEHRREQMLSSMQSELVGLRAEVSALKDLWSA